MKRTIFGMILSMTAAICLVNASAKDLPIGNRAHKKASLKDSVDGKTHDLQQLIAILMKTGEDDQLTQDFSPVIGMTGTPRTRGRDFTLPRANGKERRECSIVFPEDGTEKSSTGVKRPSCLYFQHKIVSGHDSESEYYRLNVEGKLEKATVLHGKFDDDGKPIQGSGVTTERDINSPEVQKDFRAEFAYWTKVWVKAEKKAEAHGAAKPVMEEPTPASSATPAQ